MLQKWYTIPVVLGACLGMVMVGVQISATALNAALGAERPPGLVVIKGVDRHSIKGQVLGCDFTIHTPHAGELTACAKVAAGDFGEMSKQALNAGRNSLEELERLSGTVYGEAAELLKKIAGAVMEKFGDEDSHPSGGLYTIKT